MNEILSPEALRNFPKIELHVHLDCCLSFDAVSQLKPGITREEYETQFIGPQKCEDLADFLKCTVPPLALLQTRRGLRTAVGDLFRQFHRDNVIYAEIRFAPLQHLEQGLSPEEVVSTVEEAISESVEDTGIAARLLLCTLRHFSEEQSMMTAALVEDFRGTRVAGMDLAADEAGFPLDEHIRAFEYVNNRFLPTTAHAGEALGAGSVKETLELLKPHRIGHGVRSVEDLRIIKQLKKENIHLEVCPSCNVQIDVFDTYEKHPIQRLCELGISVSINTDTRTISNLTLSQEYERLQQVFGWGRGKFLQCNRNALEAAFLPDKKKRELAQKLFFGYRG